MSLLSVSYRAVSLLCLVALATVVRGLIIHPDIGLLVLMFMTTYGAAWFWEMADTDWSDDDSEEGKL